MDKNNSILIYEKENHLNSILYQQVSHNNNYETYTANDQTNLLKLINKKTFDICIFNVEDIDTKLTNFLDILLNKNQHINIIGYGKNLSKNDIINSYNIAIQNVSYPCKVRQEPSANIHYEHKSCWTLCSSCPTK